MRFFLVILFIFSSTSIFAVETCSRTAIINYQEVLVDSNSSQRGEGLRYHLEKDPIAKELLDTYQRNSALKWPSAVIGTTGTGLLLYGFFNSDSENRRLYIISGTATILVNFLIARTIEVSNESNLKRAIEEYNKRNLPKIFFEVEGSQSYIDYSKVKIGLAQQWTF